MTPQENDAMMKLHAQEYAEWLAECESLNDDFEEPKDDVYDGYTEEQRYWLEEYDEDRREQAALLADLHQF